MDPEYLRWLEIYHPEAIPTDRYSLETAPSSTLFQASSSVVEHFSPLQGTNITGSSTEIETSSSSCIHESHDQSRGLVEPEYLQVRNVSSCWRRNS